MSWIPHSLAALMVLGGFALAFKKKETVLKKTIQVICLVVAISAIAYSAYESAQAEEWRQEIDAQLGKIAKAVSPDLSDKEAIKFLLAELGELIIWSDRQQRASMLGITLPRSPSQVPISYLSELLTHEDPLARSFAALSLTKIGTPEAKDALKNVEQNSQK